MGRYLVTPSLYSSYLWYRDTDFYSLYDDAETAENAERKAYQEFLDSLMKIEKPRTEAMQKGVDFENMVTAFTNNQEVEMTDEALAAQEVARILGKGGVWQYRLRKEIGNDYIIYGIADYIAKNCIFDVKRTSQYEIAEYNKSIQHLVYLECAEGIDNFKYVIAAGKSSPSIFVEDYQKQPNNQEILIGKIDLMVDFIKSVPELYKPYREKWYEENINA